MTSYFQIPDRRKPLSRSTILLVDDDALESHVRADALEEIDLHVRRVSDAAHALILLSDERMAGSVALVIVALHQPGLSGPEFVHEVASRLPEVPLLVIGRRGETDRAYAGEPVYFSPSDTPMPRFLTEVRGCLRSGLRRAAYHCDPALIVQKNTAVDAATKLSSFGVRQITSEKPKMMKNEAAGLSPFARQSARIVLELQWQPLVVLLS